MVCITVGTSATGTENNGLAGGTDDLRDESAANRDLSKDPSRAPNLSRQFAQSRPADAVVLFDGKNLDRWASQKARDWEEFDGPARWKIVDGEILQVVPGAGSIITKQQFSDFTLHLEFRVPHEETNGGVYLLARYELNISDRFAGRPASACGAFANLIPPIGPRQTSDVAKPDQWHVFEIDFTAPRFDADKSLVNEARATVALDGRVIHDDVPLGSRRGAAKRLGDAASGPIMLQEHGTAYQFRNIWIEEKSK